MNLIGGDGIGIDVRHVTFARRWYVADPGLQGIVEKAEGSC